MDMQTRYQEAPGGKSEAVVPAGLIRFAGRSTRDVCSSASEVPESLTYARLGGNGNAGSGSTTWLNRKAPYDGYRRDEHVKQAVSLPR